MIRKTFFSEASGQGFDIKADLFPFKANGRALTLEREDGFIRTVVGADNHILLGIQGVGAGTAELSAAFSLALAMGARLADVAFTIHAHQTQSEAFHEAALKCWGTQFTSGKWGGRAGQKRQSRPRPSLHLLPLIPFPTRSTSSPVSTASKAFTLRAVEGLREPR
jgi:hypothetical protein